MYTPYEPSGSEVLIFAHDMGTSLYIGGVEISIGDSCAEEAKSCVNSMLTHHIFPSCKHEDCGVPANESMPPTSTSSLSNTLVEVDGWCEPIDSLGLKE